MKHILGKISDQRLRYLIAGLWNTGFGYFVGINLYNLIGEEVGVLVVGVVSNVIAITMSFLTYKIFVFRTSGSWISEYFRAYFVYGSSAIIGIGILIVLVNFIGIKFWISQGLVILITVIISYLGHKKFTFKKNN